MDNVVSLFKERRAESVVTTVVTDEFFDITEKNIFTDINLQIELLKQRIVKLHSEAPVPKLVGELGRSYDGLYTLLDVVSSCVSGTMIPSYTSKGINICKVVETPDIYGIQMTLAENQPKESEITNRVLTMSLLQIDIDNIDTDLMIGAIDEKWDDLTQSGDWDVPYYMASVIDTLAYVAMVNSGFGEMDKNNRFIVNLPYHPSRCIQVVAQIR